MEPAEPTFRSLRRPKKSIGKREEMVLNIWALRFFQQGILLHIHGSCVLLPHGHKTGGVGSILRVWIVSIVVCFHKDLSLGKAVDGFFKGVCHDERPFVPASPKVQVLALDRSLILDRGRVAGSCYFESHRPFS